MTSSTSISTSTAVGPSRRVNKSAKKNEEFLLQILGEPNENGKFYKFVSELKKKLSSLQGIDNMSKSNQDHVELDQNNNNNNNNNNNTITQQQQQQQQQQKQELLNPTISNISIHVEIERLLKEYEVYFKKLFPKMSFDEVLFKLLSLSRHPTILKYMDEIELQNSK